MGCVNAAYYYAKRKGENIFSIGSATAGATNIARKFGVKAGIAVGVFDGLKMIAALWLVQRITGGSDVYLGATMIACICGHIFPTQLGFHGGKGASCLLGAALYLLPWQALAVLGALFLVCFSFQRDYKKSGFVTMVCSPLVFCFYVTPLLAGVFVVSIGLVVYSHLPKKIKFKVARSKDEFEQIARLNYRTFVEEIPQHAANSQHTLTDKMHAKNMYIVAKKGARVVGMVALNDKRPFSLDQKIPNLDDYLQMKDKHLCEVRLLSISPDFRKGKILAGLLGSISRYVEQNHVEYLLISATTRELKMYRSIGFEPFYQLVGKEGAWYQPMLLKITSKETSKWNR